MGIKIKFDSSGNVIAPTFVLTTRGGVKVGNLPAKQTVFKNGMADPSELSFVIDKVDCGTYKKGGKTYKIWNAVKDFKLLWVKDWNRIYEIYVDLDDDDGVSKKISAKSLGQCELSQIRLYNLEINSESDIERDDYAPSVLYNPDKPKQSILNRVLSKAQHYRIGHVDSSISNIQRTFSFNDKSIYDSLSEIAQEIDCYISYDCYMDENYNIIREVNFYDLQGYCLECKNRGSFFDVCPECGGKNILTGYGDDTTIFIDRDNLAENIQFRMDAGSIKNMFKMEAGDDLMTATIASCNPNGSLYVFKFSEDDLEDMSNALVSKLRAYSVDYDYYYKEYVFSLDADLVAEYNALVDKYKTDENNLVKIPSPVVGYSKLMELIYEIIDFDLYLKSGLMPTTVIPSTTAEDEVRKLSAFVYTSVAVQNLQSCSLSTATNSVLSMAKVMLDGRYKITAADAAYANNIWSGKIVVTNYSDVEDTATSDVISVNITDDYENFIKQKIDKSLNKSSSDVTDIVSLFDLEADDFAEELKKYGLNSLNRIHTSCQACLNILIEQGVMNNDDTLLNGVSIYQALYLPMYGKFDLIAREIQVRESEIATISGTYNVAGEVTHRGVRILLDEERTRIQNLLNFESYIGEELWLEFIAYRREDTYRNTNYISDGLNNAQLIKRAVEFIDVAQNEINKSSTMQYSITSSLRNLLVMKEFAPILDKFELGNWLRIKVDDTIYKLRLIDYEIDFDNLDILDVQFSDVTKISNSTSEMHDLVNSIKSITTSYDSTKRQAGQGEKSNEQMDSWVTDGLSLTQMKIVDTADDQNIKIDEQGILLREYQLELGDYDAKQLRIINNGLYVTDDNWLTSRAGIGNFYYLDPLTGEVKEGYGIIADKIIGNIMLSKEVSIFNSDASISLDRNGFTLTSDYSSTREDRNVFTIQKRSVDENGEELLDKQMYLDDDGNLVLNGTIGVYTNGATRYLTDLSNDVKAELQLEYKEEIEKTSNSISDKYDANIAEVYNTINNFKNDLGKYMTFGDTGLIIGAATSPYKTNMDNNGLYFKYEDLIVSYISNKQLYIPNAVIEDTLTLGNFFFSPREDGSFSLTWQS